MVDLVLKVLQQGQDILNLDFIGTSVSQDFIAGLVVQRTLDLSPNYSSLIALQRAAEKVDGVTRQAILIRYWDLILDNLRVTNKPDYVRREVCESILSSVDLHTQAFGLASSLQAALVLLVNQAVDLACSKFSFDDVIIYLGIFCGAHRAYIRAQRRLFVAPAIHLRTLCNYRDPRCLLDVLKANLALCEFAMKFNDSSSELLRIVIYDTLVRTLRRNIETKPYLRSILRENLEKFYSIFSPIQLQNLAELCDQPPNIPLERGSSKATEPALIDVEDAVKRAFQKVQKGVGEAVETTLGRVVESRQENVKERVIVALKHIARAKDFNSETNRRQFSELLTKLSQADLLRDDDVEEFKYQYFPTDTSRSQGSVDNRKFAKPQLSTDNAYRRSQAGAIKIKSNTPGDDLWEEVNPGAKKAARQQEELKQSRAKPVRGEDSRAQSSREETLDNPEQPISGVDLHQEIDAIIELNACGEDDQVKVSQLVSRFTALSESLPMKRHPLTIGSAALGLWIKSSPYDMALMLDDTVKVQKVIGLLVEALNSSAFAVNVRQVEMHLGPTVQYTDKTLDLTMSVSFQSRVPLVHKKLLYLFTQLDSRFTSLVLVIKSWAKARGFLGAEFYSGYEWTLLIACFCQTRTPTVLPALQTAQHQPCMVDGCDVWFDEQYSKESFNRSELSDLLIEFFWYYGVEIAGEGVIADVRTGELQGKTEDQTALFAIVDPFLPNILGDSVRIGSSQAVALRSELARAYRELADNKSSLLSLLSL
jgi:hypothetical protein